MNSMNKLASYISIICLTLFLLSCESNVGKWDANVFRTDDRKIFYHLLNSRLDTLARADGATRTDKLYIHAINGKDTLKYVMEDLMFTLTGITERPNHYVLTGKDDKMNTIMTVCPKEYGKIDLEEQVEYRLLGVPMQKEIGKKKTHKSPHFETPDGNYYYYFSYWLADNDTVFGNEHWLYFYLPPTSYSPGVYAYHYVDAHIPQPKTPLKKDSTPIKIYRTEQTKDRVRFSMNFSINQSLWGLEDGDQYLWEAEITNDTDSALVLYLSKYKKSENVETDFLNTGDKTFQQAIDGLSSEDTKFYSRPVYPLSYQYKVLFPGQSFKYIFVISEVGVKYPQWGKSDMITLPTPDISRTENELADHIYAFPLGCVIDYELFRSRTYISSLLESNSYNGDYIVIDLLSTDDIVVWEDDRWTIRRTPSDSIPDRRQ